MFSLYLLDTFSFLKQKNFKYLKKKNFIKKNFFSFSYKKTFFILKQIYGFSFQFLFFSLTSLGFNFKSFSYNSKYFLHKYLNFVFLNKKFILFLFFIRHRFGFCREFFRFFFFQNLKKKNCLKQMLVGYGLPLRGQRTKTNAVTAHFCFFSKSKVKFFSLKKRFFFLF